MRTPQSHRLRKISVFAALAVALVAVSASGAQGVTAQHPISTSSFEADGTWTWPTLEARAVIEPFRAPEQAWSAGHRGVDVRASHGQSVRAPAAGRIAFVGVVVDRPLLTIDHGAGLVTTLEPVDSDLSVGDDVIAGQLVATVARGGHTPSGSVHLGVRWHGDYINPMLLFGEVPRAVLLPCCD